MNSIIKNVFLLALLCMPAPFLQAGIWEYFFGDISKAKEQMMHAATFSDLSELERLIKTTNVSPWTKVPSGVFGLTSSVFDCASKSGQRVIIRARAEKLKVSEEVIIKEAIDAGHTGRLIQLLLDEPDAKFARQLVRGGMDPFVKYADHSLFEHQGWGTEQQTEINRVREYIAEAAAELQGTSKDEIFRQAAREIGPNSPAHYDMNMTHFEEALRQNDSNMIKAFIEVGADTRNAESLIYGSVKSLLYTKPWYAPYITRAITRAAFTCALKDRADGIERTLSSYDADLEKELQEEQRHEKFLKELLKQPLKTEDK